MKTQNRPKENNSSKSFQARIEYLKRQQPQKPDDCDYHERSNALRQPSLKDHHVMSDEEEDDAADGDTEMGDDEEDDATDGEAEVSDEEEDKATDGDAEMGDDEEDDAADGEAEVSDEEGNDAPDGDAEMSHDEEAAPDGESESLETGSDASNSVVPDSRSEYMDSSDDDDDRVPRGKGAVGVEPLQEIHIDFTLESTDHSFADRFHERLLEICANCPATPKQFLDDAEKLATHARTPENRQVPWRAWLEDIEPQCREEAKSCRDERKEYWEYFQFEWTMEPTGDLIKLEAILRPKLRPVLIVKLGLRSGISSTTREGVTGGVVGKSSSRAKTDEQVLPVRLSTRLGVSKVNYKEAEDEWEAPEEESEAPEEQQVKRRVAKKKETGPAAPNLGPSVLKKKTIRPVSPVRTRSVSPPRTALTCATGYECQVVSLLSDDDEAVISHPSKRPPRPTLLHWEERAIKDKSEQGIKTEDAPAEDSKATGRWEVIHRALEDTKNLAALNSKSAIFKCFSDVRHNLQCASEKRDLAEAESKLEELGDITSAVWNEINRKMQ